MAGGELQDIAPHSLMSQFVSNFSLVVVDE